VKLLHHIAVRSDFFSCPGPSPIVAASAAAFSIALIDHQPRLNMLLAASVLAVMVLTMTWLVLVIARRLWCDRHPYRSQPSTGARVGQLNP
jgi:hypothetical protein